MNTTKTKIICTIGPACDSAERLGELMDAGMNVARLNFSHNTHAYYGSLIARIRAVAEDRKVAIAILQDLQGPKIRIGGIAGGEPVQLVAGAEFIITSTPVPGDSHMVSTTFAELPHVVKPGDQILMDDGNLELQVLATSGDQVRTRVVTGGALFPQKGINLPGLTTNIESLTDKDRQDLVFGLANDVDFVAVSFVQIADDLRTVRDFIALTAPDKAETPIIAKLERPAAVENLEQLLAVCEGVMVARGDLGVEMAPHRIPAIQKHIIQRANATGRIVITATQMLESMIENPRPTRAEASDVANAIFDGSDAVMLSAETANGAHPVGSVRMMRRIIEEAEQHVGEWGHYHDQLTPTSVTSVALARAAAKLANTLPIAAIVVFTRTGNNTLVLSKERPSVPIIGCTAHERARRRMALMHGTTPHMVPQAHSLNEMVEAAEHLLLNQVGLQLGQQVVIIVGLPVEHMRPANIVMVHVLGDKR